MYRGLLRAISAAVLSGLAIQAWPQQPEVELKFYNPVTAKVLEQHHPEQELIYRAELPPAVYIEALAPNAASVIFRIDEQSSFIDNAAPFHLEDLPTRAFTLTATAFSETEGKGRQIGEKRLKVSLSDLGMPKGMMSAAEHQAWLKSELDKALARKLFKASNGMKMPYRLFVPPDYSPKVRYPLVVFLHGRGERGTDNRPEMFNQVGLFTGTQSIVSPNGQSAFPAIVLVPQCSDRSPDEEWAKWIGNSAELPFDGLGMDGTYQQALSPSASGAAAIELIETLLGQYNIDRQRIYLTGISMGGFGTWDLTSRRPDLFAAAVPMAGYVDPTKVGQLQGIPFWIFHGDQDEFNPVAGSRKMHEQLRALGSPVEYTELKGAKHSESFKTAWQNAQILPWLFAQNKQP